MAKKQKTSDDFRTPTSLDFVEDIEVVKASYTPEGFESAEEYLRDMRETYAFDLESDDDNRRAALEDKKFVAGEQWDPEVLEQRKGLPCLTINTIPQFTAQLVGDWRENKTGIKVLPSESGDKNIADVRSSLIRSIQTRNRADRVLDSAFESMVQCGDGAFRIGVQYTSDDVFDQDIVIRPIDDALSVVWDALSIDPTGRDAMHCFVDDVIPLKEFKAKWPEADPSTLSDGERKLMVSNGWLSEQTARVTEHWRIIERKKMLFMFEDGSMHSIDEERDSDNYELNSKIDTIFQRHGQPVKARLAPCRYVQMHLVTGFKILAGPYEWKLNRLPIIRMAGRTVTMGDRRVRYGLVRFMKDSARLRNFFRSQAVEMLGYTPKATWIANESAVEGREDEFRNAHKSRNPLLVVNDDAIIDQNIKRVDPPQIQVALLNESQINAQDLKDVTGIHDASLGIKSNETSGKAIMARQREGDVASNAYYDTGNAAVLEAGDVINQLIGQIYDGTRIVRIIGEDEATKLVTINDPMDPSSPNLAEGKYDVAMTTGPSYTTRRLEAAQAMMEAIQVFPQLMQVAGDIIVKAQDWPGAEELSERMRKTIPPQLLSEKEKQEMGQQSPDMAAIMEQQAMAQEQMAQAMEQLKKLEDENLVLKTKAEIEANKLEIERQKAAIEEFRAQTERMTAYAQLIKEGEAMELQKHEIASNEAMRQEELEQSRVGLAKDILSTAHSVQKDSTPPSESTAE